MNHTHGSHNKLQVPFIPLYLYELLTLLSQQPIFKVYLVTLQHEVTKRV